MRRAGRTDGNQTSVVSMLRQLPGVTVQPISGMGGGVPDLLIGVGGSGGRGKNYLIELKDGRKPPSARELTDAELRWHKAWRGQVAVCETFEQVLEVMGLR